MNRAARCLDIRGKAEVVLHVTQGVVGVDVVFALELLEQLRGRLADYVDQHVETSAMGHPEDDFLDLTCARTLDEFVEQRDQAIATFQ